MTRIDSINKLHISKFYRFEEVCDYAKNTTYFQSNNSIIFTTQFHSTYGSIMPGRYFSSGTGYAYGFNGKENDNEVKGIGNQVVFEARIYDSRLGRWLSVDPLANDYPELSTYNYINNSPIFLIDPDGKRIFIYYQIGEDENSNPIYARYEYGSKQKVPKDKFVCQTIRTLNMIQKKKCDKFGIINRLTKDNSNVAIFKKKELFSSSFSIQVGEAKVVDENGKMLTKEESGIDQMINPLAWRIDEDLISKDGSEVQCSAKLLLHELAHKYYTIYDPEGNQALSENCTNEVDSKEWYETVSIECGNYHNYADRWIITKVEKDAFKGNWSRNNHTEGFILKLRVGHFQKKEKNMVVGVSQV